jgi:signal transduction histidine kinase
MRSLTRPDVGTLGAGISILALGAFLLGERSGALEASPVLLLSVLGGCGVFAIAASLAGGRDFPRVAAALSWAGFGLALLCGAGLLSLWATGALEGAGEAVLAALVVAIALGLISAPLWLGVFRRLSMERSARIRSEERAELGAHLHDSVLQTLALMQRSADDPARVSQLARHQERELRSWLAGEGPARPEERLADALHVAAGEVEDQHGAQVEVVVVGDAALDERLEALVAATREALTNAAKFAAAGGPVRLYAEIDRKGSRVWIDDRGPGFDPKSLPGDRRGVRESIIGRMERHGGKAEIRSGEDGTEVVLEMNGGRR